MDGGSPTQFLEQGPMVGGWILQSGGDRFVHIVPHFSLQAHPDPIKGNGLSGFVLEGAREIDHRLGLISMAQRLVQCDALEKQGSILQWYISFYGRDRFAHLICIKWMGVGSAIQKDECIIPPQSGTDSDELGQAVLQATLFSRPKEDRKRRLRRRVLQVSLNLFGRWARFGK